MITSHRRCSNDQLSIQQFYVTTTRFAATLQFVGRFEAIAKPLGFEILTYRELNVKWIKAISFRFWIGRLILARLFDKMHAQAFDS